MVSVLSLVVGVMGVVFGVVGVLLVVEGEDVHQRLGPAGKLADRRRGEQGERLREF